METSALSPAQARLRLTILNKQAEAKDSYEFHAEMKDMRLPGEVIEILEKLLKVTSKVAEKTISIGKIIVAELLDYVVKHPLQVAGLAVGLGAAFTLGIAVHGLFCLVPALHNWWIIGAPLSHLAQVIASLCQTVATPFMLIAPIAGAVAGETFDKKYPEISESLEQVTKDFFGLLSQIINSIKDDFNFVEANQAFT
jgi:hypothetical protein